MPAPKSNLLLGLGCIGIAMLIAFVWVPLDTETGIVEQVRRRQLIGDSLAPTVAAIFIAIAGLGLLLFERKAEAQPRVSVDSLRFVGAAVLTVVVGILAMRFAGPLAVALVQPLSTGELEYRLLRDTAPWKHIGFLLGGTFLVAALISLAEQRPSWRAVLIGASASLAIIAAYDLPFDDLLLPPNGDV